MQTSPKVPIKPRILTPKTPPSPLHDKLAKEPTGATILPFNPGEKRTWSTSPIKDINEEHWQKILMALQTSPTSEAGLWENIKYVLPDIETIKTFDLRKLQLAAIASIGILAFASTNSAYANSPSGQVNIKKAQTIIETVDPIKLLILRNPEKGNQSKTFDPDEEDKLWMSRNIGAEAETLGEPGKIGIMISVLERVNNPRFPKSIKEVILQAYQYSWANSLEKNPNLPKTDSKNTNLVDESIIHGMNVEDNLIVLRKRLLENLNNIGLPYSELPAGATDYHVLGIFDNDKYKSGVKSQATKKKILLLQYLATTNDLLDPKLETAKKNFFYIPHKRELDKAGKFAGIINGGLGHIHYTYEFNDKNNIGKLFALVPQLKAKLDSWK